MVNQSQENTHEERERRCRSQRKKRFLTIVGGTIVLLLAVIIGISTFGGRERKLQEQLDLGTRYLEEMNYEEAVVAFNAALKIEPKSVDAYLGIVEVYIRTNEFDLALETAKEGYEVTGDERLKEKIDMIESGGIFASNGWMMKSSHYDGAGNLIFWHEYTYNLKGQLASVANYNAQGVQQQYLELTYDEQGRSLVTYSGYSVEDGTLYKKSLEYSGDNCRETYYNESGEANGYADVEADSDGKPLKCTSYNVDGRLSGIDVYEYNELGDPIKWEHYDADNRLYRYEIFTYDGDGNCLQLQYYDADGTLLCYSEWTYDDEGNCTGYRDYDGDGNLSYEEKYQ